MIKKGKFWNTFIRMPESAVVIGIVIVLAVLAIVTKGDWFSGYIITKVLRTTSFLGIIAIGQAFLIISGEFDLSVGSVYGFTGLLYIWLAGGLRQEVYDLIPTGLNIGPLPAFIIVMVIGLIIGLFHGILVTKVKIPSLIVTLGSMFIFRGIIYLSTQGFPMTMMEELKTNIIIRNLKVALIYYDELNIGNGWYISGWCPQFESGSVLITDSGYTAILGGPESEPFAKMDCAIKETKNLPVFMVPDEEYPYAEITDFRHIFKEIFGEVKLKKIGVVGLGSMPYGVYDLLVKDLKGTQVIDITEEYEALRIRKSEYEIRMIRRSFEIADVAFKEMLENVKEGVTETYLAGVAEGRMRKLGANRLGFQTIVATEERSCGVVPTATERKLKKGDSVMLGISPRYNGYAAAAGCTAVVDSEPTSEQKDYFKMLSEAYLITRDMLKPGMVGKDNYKKVKKYFKDKGGYEKYIVCPFAHTIGLHEAESPFFGPNSDDILEPGMTVCVDVSLFGHPGFNGMRVETGFLITDKGCEPFSTYVDGMIEDMSNL